MTRCKKMISLALVLVAQNLIVFAAGASVAESNIACVAAFVYFNMSLSPESFLGFALTVRDWGDVLRREKKGDYDPDGPEFGRAAARSFAILSGLVVFAFCLEFVRRGDRSFSSTLAILAGIEAGLVSGYLVATRNRSSAT